jgi:hypothetical protein
VSTLRNLLPPAVGLDLLLAPPLGAGIVALFTLLVHHNLLPAALSPTANPPAVIGHFLTAVLLILVSADMHCAMTWRHAALHFTPGDNSWVDRAISFLTAGTGGRPDRERFGDELGGLCLLLRRRLQVRVGVKYFPLAWLPLILGLVSSTWSLEPAGMRNETWLGIFWPFLVGAAETLLLSWGSYLVSAEWDRALGAFLVAAEEQAGAAPPTENGVSRGRDVSAHAEAAKRAPSPKAVPHKG